MPTASSKKVNYFIPLSGTAQLKIKSFSNRNTYDKVVSASFKEGKALAASPKPKEGKAVGLQYAYFEGTWDKLPNFNKLKPVKAGPIKEDFKLNENSMKAHSAYLMEGQVEITAEGYYIFYIESAQDLKLYIGDKLIIDGAGLESNGKQSYVLPLEKGVYPVRLELLHKKGGNNLRFTIYQSRKNKKDEWWRNVFLSF